MSYYNELQKAYKELDSKLAIALNNGERLNIPALLLKLTVDYPVGEKPLLKRIEKYLSVNKKLRLENNELFEEE